MNNTEENKGYTLAVMNCKAKKTAEKVYMKPMALYVPTVAAGAVAVLVDCLGETEDCAICDVSYLLTVTNNNNGVSVDKEFKALADLAEPANAAEAVKELINIVRGYDAEDDHNVCGW